MTGLAVVLVLISAVAHASWNMLIRRSATPELTNWMMVSAGALLASPLGIYLLLTSPPEPIGWVFVVGTIILHIVYFFTLGRAYKHGDLSLVYPIARGLGLALIPIIGVTVLEEKVSILAAAGIVVIFFGIITVGSSSGDGLKVWLKPRSLLADRSVIFAVLTGVFIAAYSTLDKRGVEYVEPVLYMFTLTLGGSIGILLIIRRNYSREDFSAEIRKHWRIGLAGGVLQFAAYALVLSAFRLSPVSYVGPFRELGIVVGVVLAALILRESITRNRAIGAAAIGTGAIFVAIAP